LWPVEALFTMGKHFDWIAMPSSKPGQLKSQRHPRRITITVSQRLLECLQLRSDEEGRSLSNLSSFLLELALKPGDGLSQNGRTIP
jgi:hypothetical protein